MFLKVRVVSLESRIKSTFEAIENVFQFFGNEIEFQVYVGSGRKLNSCFYPFSPHRTCRIGSFLLMAKV